MKTPCPREIHANPRVNVPKSCKHQWIFPAQGVGSNEHFVGRTQNTVHARSSLLTSWLSDSGVLTKRNKQNRQKKYYNTRKEYQVIDVCLPFLLCLHSVHERADDVSCLRELGAQRYVNTYIDRQVETTIKILRSSVLIGRKCLDPMPSTEYTGAGHIIRISSKSRFISLIPFKK